MESSPQLALLFAARKSRHLRFRPPSGVRPSILQAFGSESAVAHTVYSSKNHSGHSAVLTHTGVTGWRPPLAHRWGYDSFRLGLGLSDVRTKAKTTGQSDTDRNGPIKVLRTRNFDCPLTQESETQPHTVASGDLGWS